MMFYESVYLPIINKYLADPKKSMTDLVHEICNVKDPFYKSTGTGYYHFNRTFHVEERWFDGRLYTQSYGGFSLISEAEALKADKISIAKYAGMTEIKIDIEYYKDNPLTHQFIIKELRQVPLSIQEKVETTWTQTY